MSKKPKCTRCGGHWPTSDNFLGNSFWGTIQRKTEVVTTKLLRVASVEFRYSTRRNLQSEGDMPLCSSCWSLLVSKFLEGHSVPDLKEQQRQDKEQTVEMALRLYGNKAK